MEEMVMEFYRKVIFGKNYKGKGNISKIIECCVTNAWNDMIAHTRNNPDKIVGDGANSEIKNKLINTIIKTIENNDCTFKFEKTLDLLNDERLTLGQKQKFINMTFKYLYTFKDELRINKDKFKNCHCPIDNKIKKNLIEEFNKSSKYVENLIKLKSWSKLKDKTLYDAIQTDLDLLVKDKHYSSKLELDFLFWNKG